MKERIRAIRKEAGLSQDKFSEELGISKSNVQSYELGRRSPSDAVISLICNKYFINETWLRSGEGEMHGSVTKEDEIAGIMARLYKEEESSFFYQLVKVLADLDADELGVLESAARKLKDGLK